MSSFIPQFEKAILVGSDINQHLPTLWCFSTQCERIIECGYRYPVSTWAFIQGLKDNSSNIKEIISVDTDECPKVDEVKKVATEHGVKWEFLKENDIKIDFKSVGKVDMIFIDTWHVYGHLKRELAYFHKWVNKYIIMHDTTVDAIYGETIRMGLDAQGQSEKSGYPIEEINRGLWPAVKEFLKENNNWKLKARFNHNNGLTILERTK